MRMTVSSKRTWSIIMIVSLIFSMLGIPPSTADANSAPSQVTLVGTLQSELGHSADWDRRRDNHERYGERRIQVYRLARGIVRIQDCDRRQVGRELRLRPLFQSERSKQGWQHPHNARSRFPGYLYYNHGTHRIADSTYYAPIEADKLPRVIGASNRASAKRPTGRLLMRD